MSALITPLDLAASVGDRLRETPAGEWPESRLPRVWSLLSVAGEVLDQVPTRQSCVLALALGEDVDEELAPAATPAIARVHTQIAVIVGVPARHGPRKAAEKSEDIAALVRTTRQRLTGWEPARHWQPLAIRRARLLSLEDGRAWWQDEYQTTSWSTASHTRAVKQSGDTT